MDDVIMTLHLSG